MADSEKKSLVEEFKEFISQGDAMDMAVGVIIGGAFTAIVTALTDDIITPVIQLVAGGAPDVSGLMIPGTSINIGNFIGAIINFLIVALCLFSIIKALNKAQATAAKLAGKEEAPAEEPAPAPVCPHCLEEVKEGATRCPHCAGEIPGGAHAA